MLWSVVPDVSTSSINVIPAKGVSFSSISHLERDLTYYLFNKHTRRHFDYLTKKKWHTNKDAVTFLQIIPRLHTPAKLLPWRPTPNLGCNRAAIICAIPIYLCHSPRSIAAMHDPTDRCRLPPLCRQPHRGGVLENTWFVDPYLATPCSVRP